MVQKLESRAEATRRIRREFDAYGPTVLLSEPEAAAIVGFSSHTLKFWRASQSMKGPRPVFLHGAVRYEVSEIRRWRAETLRSGRAA